MIFLKWLKIYNNFHAIKSKCCLLFLNLQTGHILFLLRNHLGPLACAGVPYWMCGRQWTVLGIHHQQLLCFIVVSTLCYMCQLTGYPVPVPHLIVHHIIPYDVPHHTGQQISAPGLCFMSFMRIWSLVLTGLWPELDSWAAISNLCLYVCAYSWQPVLVLYSSLLNRPY